jgi:hypothetical protein
MVPNPPFLVCPASDIQAVLPFEALGLGMLLTVLLKNINVAMALVTHE